MKPAALADLILSGAKPPAMAKRSLEKLISRTLKSSGQDGRKNSGRKAWVRTPKFCDNVKKNAKNQIRKSTRVIATKMKTSNTSVWRALRQNNNLKPKRRV